MSTSSTLRSEDLREVSSGRLLTFLSLAVALAASLLMALAQLETVELPGCGSVSDCTQATQSRWGKLPGTEWPLSFVGFAYFQALAAALLVGGGRISQFLRVVVFSGGVVSIVLVGVMLMEDYLCGYCLTIHVANLLLVGGILRQNKNPAGQPATIKQLGCCAATFVVTLLLLGWLDRQTTQAAKEATQSQLQDALNQAQLGDGEVESFAPGRYVLGPPNAKVHVTVVSDYQCPSCRRIDAQVRAMTAGRDDVAISARHFPFCTDCNEHVNKTRHANACRAAVAAEAAGAAGGTNAFWQVHDWLFERSGQFTDDELLEFVRSAGIDEAAFREALVSEQTLANVRADAEAADAAGLRFTPMVFINGRAIQLGAADSTTGSK